MLWEELNKPENRVETISHHNIEVRPTTKEEFEDEEEEFRTIYGVERREAEIPYDVAWDSPENLKKN